MALTITRLPSAFGAEVTGLDPDRVPDEEARSQLRAAFDDHGVLVFRDLAGLDRRLQTFLTELVCGEQDLGEDKVAADAQRQSTFYISNRIEDAAAPFGRLMWHSDGMWSDHPFHAISLFGEAVEPPVPPTRFASTTRSWDTLPAGLRERVTRAAAVQVPGPESFAHRRGDDEGDLVQPVRDKEYSVTKPVAFRHPRTGRTLLFVSQQMTSHIDCIPPEESEQLLDSLFEHMYAPDNVLEHDWQEGDLVLWDNLACQHARPDVKLESSVRTLRKIGWPLPPMAQKQAVGAYRRIGASS